MDWTAKGKNKILSFLEGILFQHQFRSPPSDEALAKMS